MDFKGRDVVSINDFTLEEINYILEIGSDGSQTGR